MPKEDFCYLLPGRAVFFYFPSFASYGSFIRFQHILLKWWILFLLIYTPLLPVHTGITLGNGTSYQEITSSNRRRRQRPECLIHIPTPPLNLRPVSLARLPHHLPTHRPLLIPTIRAHTTKRKPAPLSPAPCLPSPTKR